MTLVSTEKLLKRYYVGGSRQIRGALDGAALIGPPPTLGDAKLRIWLRSLLAIHDIDEMDRLDLAWWQLDALREVDAFLARTPDAKVFEYGSGASTLWLARRAAAVTSIEHDSDWHATLERKVAGLSNVTLRLVPPVDASVADRTYRSGKTGARNLSFRDYVHAIDEEAGAFDLIVIDGRCRAECLKVAERRLNPGGMIVFDNSNRARYAAAISASALESIRYRGLSACLPYPDETTLLKRVS